MKHRARKLTAAVMALAIAVTTLAGTALAKPADEKWANNAARIARQTGTELVETVHWKAKIKENVKAKVTANPQNTTDSKIGQKVRIKKKTKVTIIQRDYHEKKGKSQCQLKDGRVVYIPNKYLSITNAICSGDRDYSPETKEAYVNGQNIPSGDQYMIWISLSKQRVNVFQGSNHNWKLINTYKCSTGKADAPTLDQSFKSKYVIQWKKEKVDNLKLYSAVYGSGMHKFPGSGASSVLGSKPVSHSCIRMPEGAALWIFNNTKDKKEHGGGATRVWIW